MSRYILKLSEKIIEVNCIYESAEILCKDYISDGIPDFSVTITSEDIDYERVKSVSEDIKEGIPIRRFSDSYLETLAVYRKICNELILCNTILFHGSAVSVDGKGYIFTARSGTGKSTHTRLWREYFGERAVMINDDKPLIRICEADALVYGTPWDGKHGLSSNTSVPLKAICILERGEENNIEKISRASAYPMLLQQVNRPDNALKMKKTLELIDSLADNTELYKLRCNMNISAAETAFNGMNK